jgi:hypothetical protein
LLVVHLYKYQQVKGSEETKTGERAYNRTE